MTDINYVSHGDYHSSSDWAECMDGYLAEGSIEAPYWFYEKEKLLVISINFLTNVWEMGATEPLTLENLERAAFKVARLRFPETRKVRIAFGETWNTSHRRRMYD